MVHSKGFCRSLNKGNPAQVMAFKALRSKIDNSISENEIELYMSDMRPVDLQEQVQID